MFTIVIPRPANAACSLATQVRDGLLVVKPAVVDDPRNTQVLGATRGAVLDAGGNTGVGDVRD
jgi:hypothetical protein